MKIIIDRFGQSVKTLPADEQHFLVEVDVSISPTFYSWVFTYGGKMQILSPKNVNEEYRKRLTDALKRSTRDYSIVGDINDICIFNTRITTVLQTSPP